MTTETIIKNDLGEIHNDLWINPYGIMCINVRVFFPVISHVGIIQKTPRSFIINNELGFI